MKYLIALILLCSCKSPEVIHGKMPNVKDTITTENGKYLVVGLKYKERKDRIKLFTRKIN